MSVEWVEIPPEDNEKLSMTTDELLEDAKRETERDFPAMSEGWKKLHALCARVYQQEEELKVLRENQMSSVNIALANWAKEQLEKGRIKLIVHENKA